MFNRKPKIICQDENYFSPGDKIVELEERIVKLEEENISLTNELYRLQNSLDARIDILIEKLHIKSIGDL